MCSSCGKLRCQRTGWSISDVTTERLSLVENRCLLYTDVGYKSDVNTNKRVNGVIVERHLMLIGNTVVGSNRCQRNRINPFICQRSTVEGSDEEIYRSD
ncbi:protein ARABIDILLO 2-like [Dorcoceras hygrometricum]|uniref:Protein ARABIDILLO 2-like n=1 Tax=Dorcoceras hygrometricum TaxID=472368 RepID=A0A2Z7BE45_9LAMI|nr:protein ARABIDILLO 2-like [Dorcoceras hygrometricum]